MAGLTCYGTRLWLSDRAAKAMVRFREKKDNPKGAFMAKLAKMCRDGFEHYEGSEGMPVKAEWGGVWRVRHGRLRIIGFYEDKDKAAFIALDAFVKHGQKLTVAERARVDGVAQVRRGGHWVKKVDYERD